jgi:hypothetical protein
MPRHDGDDVHHRRGRLHADGRIAEGGRAPVLQAERQVERGPGVTSRILGRAARQLYRKVGLNKALEIGRTDPVDASDRATSASAA